MILPPTEVAAQIYDVTLRDGNHALRHQLTATLVRDYCILASKSAVDYVEVGHGNGLGASSVLVGMSLETDETLLTAAREHLVGKQLAVHCIPGFATVHGDLMPAVALGVDAFRIASHVTEADTTAKHIEYVRSVGREAIGVLMMSHMADLKQLILECRKLEAYGATTVVLMDSAGYFTPADVSLRINAIKQETTVALGFHAHNNLGVGVANALAARGAGATVLDGAAMALGAGAGNAQLECLVAVLSREDQLDYGGLSGYLALSELVQEYVPDSLPRTNSNSILSAMAGVFSGYAPQVQAASEEFGIAPVAIWQELGARSVVAGQESIIREVAMNISHPPTEMCNYFRNGLLMVRTEWSTRDEC